MCIARSNRLFLNPGDRETLMAPMGRDGDRPADAEDGEVSSDSVEEISQEDFASRFPPSRNPRFWMGDPVRFSVLGRNYATNLSNFAWAQAVQNKPLRFEGMAVRSDGRVGGQVSLEEEEVFEVMDSSSSEEKEEGELEEGEIDSGASGVEVVGGTFEEKEPVKAQEKMEPLVVVVEEEEEEETKKEPEKEVEEVRDIDNRVASIIEDLDAITVDDAEKSFEIMCSRLLKTLDNLQQMVVGCQIPFDALVQQAFVGVCTVHSVFLKRREQRKDVLSRLLAHIKNKAPTLFKPKQMKEINVMMQSIVSEAVDKEKEGKPLLEPISVNSSEAVDKEKEGKPLLEPISVNSSDSTSGRDISAFPKLPKVEPLLISKNRVDYYPLLDPCAKHDEDSLPSPTRENVLPLLTLKSYVAGAGEVLYPSTPTKKEETEDSKLHPYITDALKAVSSYQQKHCLTSFVPSNRLPSPTPSEECNDDDGDSHGEISSSSVVSSVRAVNSSIPLQFFGSSSITACTEGSSGQGLLPVTADGQERFKPKPVAKASKSRDPRLRFANPEVGQAVDLSRQNLPPHNNEPENGLTGGAIINPRKQKITDEAVLDIGNSKRQRNGILSRDLNMSSARGGWLDGNNVIVAQPSDGSQLMESMEVENRKLENGEICSNRRQDINSEKTNVRNEQVQNGEICSQWPSLLKDIAVNPTMLMHLIKEQQKLEAEARLKAPSLVQDAIHPSSTNRSLGTVFSAKIIPSLVSKAEQRTEKLRMPVQTASTNSQNDGGKIRMKPRDPRRILHNNMFQKSENLGSEQLKANETPSLNILKSKDSSTVREQGEQPQTATLPSQSIPPPDIAKQFTKKLKNLADIISTSEATNDPPAAPQKISQTMPTKTDKMDVGPVATESNNEQSISVVTQEGSRTGIPQSSNPWGDVDHLLDGYDDQQKATIQMERARRIDEQNKMFASRKLCLVLDLDHTLLNSAKFVEVDPVHDEILRKKEEQDREKPQRHLFRFQHLGMWTKLRPGIWNFLEKASKLYELHLYTMGNKLYATEMAKVLDPTGALFAGRVISKGDDSDSFDGDERLPKSKDLDGVLGMESAVVIIDDSVRVWPHHRLNLIVVERYTYFPCSRWQFGLPGPSLLEIDHDERPEDGTLASSLAVIERIHHNFFSHHCLNDVDVRNILSSEQRKILSGCRIVFSRIFPVGEANPHLHPLWQTAEQFGAICTNQIDDKVTHVVANSLGTDKVNWALSTGRFVVHPGWVEASALLYRRANEHDFSVKI